MSQRRIKSHPKLSVEEVRAICGGLLALGDETFRYADQLASAGFRAFAPRWKFTESFCAAQEELELHRRCVIERARSLVGRPWPPLYVRWTAAERALLYASPLLERLRIERDKENGVPQNELSNRYPLGEASWRREIDPCHRRQLMADVGEPLAYKERWNAVLDEEVRALEREVAQQATGISRAHTFDRNGRYALFAAIMERDATPFGFCYDRGKSRPNYPVFSKSVSKDWDICWVIEEADMFYWNPLEGRFMPFLEVRGRIRKGRIDNLEPGECLHIRYAGVVPGFFNAYRTFHTLDQLETMIKAHLCLYHLMAPIIEGALKRVLGER
jgi:hypothetical protein